MHDAKTVPGIYRGCLPSQYAQGDQGKLDQGKIGGQDSAKGDIALS
jgi:hypothetical protein